MRIVVCLKRVPDPATVEVDPLTGLIDEERLLYVAGSGDLAALEVALQFAGNGGEVQALAVGSPVADEILREALAVGASEALRIWDHTLAQLNPAQTALLLAVAVQVEAAPDLILCATHSSDSGSGQVPVLLAEFLHWPVVTDVTQIKLAPGLARVQRRLDRGAREELEVDLPAVLAVEPGIARLRHAGLPGLLRAQRASIPSWNLARLGLEPPDLALPAMTVRTLYAQRPRSRPIFTPDSDRPPHERIAQILTAGVSRKSGKVLEGSPDAMADAVVAFLRERGFV